MYGVNVYKKLEEERGIEYVNSIKQKISQNVSGEKNGFYGKHHTEETKRKLSYAVKNSEAHIKASSSPEVREKIKEGMRKSEKYQKELERRKTPEYRQEKRIQRMKQVALAISPGPSFNQKACKVFDIISSEEGIHIRHAMNEGEFCVSELGFYLDGYDAENNVAYEFDEDFHFVGGKLRPEDVERQTMIENILHCTFIRLKDRDYDENGHKILSVNSSTVIEISDNNIEKEENKNLENGASKNNKNREI